MESPGATGSGSPPTSAPLERRTSESSHARRGFSPLSAVLVLVLIGGILLAFLFRPAEPDKALVLKTSRNLPAYSVLSDEDLVVSEDAVDGAQVPAKLPVSGRILLRALGAGEVLRQADVGIRLADGRLGSDPVIITLVVKIAPDQISPGSPVTLFVVNADSRGRSGLAALALTGASRGEGGQSRLTIAIAREDARTYAKYLQSGAVMVGASAGR